MVMNLLDVPKPDEIPSNVPEGEYTLALQRIVKAYSKDAQAPAIKCSLVTLAEESPDQMPVDILNWCSLESDYVRVLANALAFLDGLGVDRTKLQANLNGEVTDEELNDYLATVVGMQIRCKLTVREYDNRDVNQIDSVVA